MRIFSPFVAVISSVFNDVVTTIVVVIVIIVVVVVVDYISNL